MAIGSEEGESLARWIRQERAFRTIEVGHGHAVSMLFVPEALLDLAEAPRHVVIDPHQNARFAGVGLGARVDSFVEF